MWQYRAEEKELIDLGSNYYSKAEYSHCLQQLFLINKLLGFVWDAKKLLKKLPFNATVMDVGCGSGLFVLNLARFFPQMKFKGIDTSNEAIIQANNNLTKFKLTEKVTFEEVNFNWLLPSDSVDIIFAVLFCHHLTNHELTKFFQQASMSARHSVIIYDLHRHWLSYQLYKLISPIFRNRLITHDGLISIRRSFTKKELFNLLTEAGIKNFRISWRFPFWWRIILWKK